MKHILILSTTLLLSMSACSPAPDESAESATPTSTDAEAINQEDQQVARRIEGHMNFLASDELKGRQTASPEYDIAARYVATQFHQYGLQPAGENGDWYQTVTFINSELVKDSAQFIIHSEQGDLPLQFKEQFLTSPNPLSESDLVRADLVFVGYGVDSEALGYNDYENLDVTNKIVVMLSGRPSSFPSEEGAHLASGRTKTQTAIKHGAIGIITLHTPDRDKVRKFDSYRKRAYAPSLRWVGADGDIYGSYPELKGSAYLSKDAGKQLFSAAGMDLQDIFDRIAEDIMPQGTEMDLQVTLSRQSNHTESTSPNIIGMVKGSDPQLQNEYVLYTAHLDHIGHDEVEGEADDHIKNGALDNASGVSIMLETARRFAEQQAPRRSVLFAAVTAEEKGLLGSSYYANHPTVAIESIIANINLDMPLILYPFADVVAFGAQHSTMASFVEKAASRSDIKLSPDPMPEQAIFVRSDHYSLVQKGVPSIFLMTGFQSKDPEIDGGETFKHFLATHYHKPTDEIKLPINYQAGATFTRVNYDIGREVANSDTKPRWHEGNYFGDLFNRNDQAVR